MPAGTFRGDVFGLGDPGQSCPGSLEAAYEEFRLRLDDGRQLVLPTDRIKLSRGGFDGLHIIVEGQAETGENLYISLQDELLLDHLSHLGPAGLRETARQLQQQGRSTRTWATLSLTVFLALLALAGFGLWLGFGWLVERAVGMVPPSVEKSLGQIVVEAVASDKKKLTQGPAFEAAMKIWNRLLPAVPAGHPYTLQLHVIDDPMVNALAAPGGQIILFTGLMKEVASAEELAGILAHELQHVLKKHPLKGIMQKAGLAVVLGTLFGDAGALTVVIREYGGKLAELSYSRDQEREADRLAVELLVRANIDPTRFPEFFRRLQSKGGNLPAALAILSTHPGHEEREQALQAQFRLLPATTYEPIGIDWAGLKAALTGAEQGR
ncbi:MAG: Zn-dependent protease with chaperone function [Candidatus Ozemobacter sibiricus]|jgi:Zn-dependent protease with chaperone function|uniref:Zn-dependent protease with chaperone function n=1 Tax=Candidatus Ozemobacter sibiricus TaxID=2268124 RepID=A0A367ZIY1_9BACT|nr:MAG: Zn-dependent protease with chaperone function [Candidatus Ozemobacter sibiricus]